VSYRTQFFALLLVIAVLLGVSWRFGASSSVVVSHDPRVAVLRDSLSRSRVIDSVRFRSWADSVVRLRGDSLQAVFSRRAAALRPRVSTIVKTDTLRDTMLIAGADLRTILVADSSCRVEADSLRGALLLRAAEDSSRGISYAAEVASLRRSRWWWLGAGVVIGRGSCLAF